jgi:hypothetical protein
MSAQGDALLKGMPEEEFRLWTLFVQSPQHMVPHLWRAPQWWAWGCYGTLAALSVVGWFRDSRHSAEGGPFARLGLGRRRFLFTHLVLLTGLALAYMAIEWAGDLRVTLFQPFRMATVARGLALVPIAGRLAALWGRGDLLSRSRAALIAVGLTGDWSMVVATLVEVAATAGSRIDRRAAWVASGAALLAGLHFLSRHDTQSGHVRLLMALGLVAMFGIVESRTRLLGRFQTWPSGRIARAVALSWTLPAFALVFSVVPLADTETGRPIAGWLLDRCRFAAIPRDDIERLAVWCREHTAPEARFVGPPGPKTFRLWSLRSLAFNRAGSPYHAAGLADWAERFRAHVAFEGTPAEFARAYLDNRQALERRYDELDAGQLAALAEEQGAGYVIADRHLSVEGPRGSGGSLERLHAEGEYAVYRVRPVAVAKRVGGRRR